MSQHVCSQRYYSNNLEGTFLGHPVLNLVLHCLYLPVWLLYCYWLCLILFDSLWLCLSMLLFYWCFNLFQYDRFWYCLVVSDWALAVWNIKPHIRTPCLKQHALWWTWWDNMSCYYLPWRAQPCPALQTCAKFLQLFKLFIQLVISVYSVFQYTIV